MTANEKNDHFRGSSSKRKITNKKSLLGVDITPPRPEVPLYDQHTGEPNHAYEKLTGKKNPLLDPPISHIQTNLVEPNTNTRSSNNNILSKMLMAYEPKRKNRWVLIFPDEMCIQSWVISETSRPSFKVVEKKFLGFTFSKKIVWDDIKIEFRDPISPSSSKNLMCDINPLKRFDYIIEMLDPTGVVIEKWEIKECYIKSIDFCELNYRNDGIANIKMVIKPKDVVLRY